MRSSSRSPVQDIKRNNDQSQKEHDSLDALEGCEFHAGLLKIYELHNEHQALTQTICSAFARPNFLSRLGEALGFHLGSCWLSFKCVRRATCGKVATVLVGLVVVLGAH